MDRICSWAWKGLKESPHNPYQDDPSSMREATPLTIEMTGAHNSNVSATESAYDFPSDFESIAQKGRPVTRTRTNMRGWEERKDQTIDMGSSILQTTKKILSSSCLNVLLVFVPVGLIVEKSHQSASAIFVTNAIAILPLSALLSYATESVAKTMGDTVGALMNVTFGNAVELIIFTALAKDEIRIVQASLLGSILVNLLLILGVAFFVGGLRYREQMYNSTITQMSACLMSLSVMSLLLPTAFHASFKDLKKADEAVLNLSRGTSVILLLIYGLYLFFQLRSHAYLYESTPQHIIDRSTLPGPAAGWMDSSSEAPHSDSDDSRRPSGHSRRSKRHPRRPSPDSHSTESNSDVEETSLLPKSELNAVDSINRARLGEVRQSITFSEPLCAYESNGSDHSGALPSIRTSRERERLKKGTSCKDKPRHNHSGSKEAIPHGTTSKMCTEGDSTDAQTQDLLVEPRCDDVVFGDNLKVQSSEHYPSHPFNNRSISRGPSVRRALTQNMFARSLRHQPSFISLEPSTSRNGSHGVRSHSRSYSDMSDSRALRLPFRSTCAEDGDNISRLAAIILLITSTTLVALCANFMVEAIDEATTGTGLSATFVGLIILPIVGNVAEFITATVTAVKNKMDLAIGVAIGSSIQIALFLTPVIVLLAWCMGKQMTLYFTLFETVSLFISALIVSFLVLDGRSNYLEGALLVAAYIIIAVASFYYPKEEFQSVLGGNPEVKGIVTRGMIRG